MYIYICICICICVFVIYIAVNTICIGQGYGRWIDWAFSKCSSYHIKPSPLDPFPSFTIITLTCQNTVCHHPSIIIIIIITQHICKFLWSEMFCKIALDVSDFDELCEDEVPERTEKSTDAERWTCHEKANIFVNLYQCPLSVPNYLHAGCSNDLRIYWRKDYPVTHASMLPWTTDSIATYRYKVVFGGYVCCFLPIKLVRYIDTINPT